jgi:hypothetical protein
MSYTKRQFVTAAFEEIGLASYVFDLTDSELTSACRRLDAMMADWNARGIRISYPIPSTPETTNLDEETNVPDAANEAIIINLALRIAPSYGKTVMQDSKSNARQAYMTLLAWVQSNNMLEKQLPGTLPAGAGNKPWRYDDPFLREPIDPINTGADGVLDILEV